MAGERHGLFEQARGLLVVPLAATCALSAHAHWCMRPAPDGHGSCWRRYSSQRSGAVSLKLQRVRGQKGIGFGQVVQSCEAGGGVGGPSVPRGSGLALIKDD